MLFGPNWMARSDVPGSDAGNLLATFLGRLQVVHVSALDFVEDHQSCEEEEECDGPGGEWKQGGNCACAQKHQSVHFNDIDKGVQMNDPFKRLGYFIKE